VSTNTRERIIDAAADVMRTRGFARTTTKEIARAAGFSEATLYKQFADKTDLFLAVLRERMPSFGPLLERLVAHAGEGDLRANLTEIAAAAYAFYAANFPMLGSIFSEPAILAAHRDNLRKVGAGPHRANERLVDYFRAEQQHGRVAADADLELAAAMLLGACFQTAFLASFEGNAPPTNAAPGTTSDPARNTASHAATDPIRSTANNAATDPRRGTASDPARDAATDPAGGTASDPAHGMARAAGGCTARDPGVPRPGAWLDPAALGGTIERILTWGGAS
jgi:AcrR family transcriptional regulator